MLGGLFSADLAWPMIFHTSFNFPGGSVVKESACQCRRGRRDGFDPGVGKMPWRKRRQPVPLFLPGESQGQRSLAAVYDHKEAGTAEWLRTAAAHLLRPLDRPRPSGLPEGVRWVSGLAPWLSRSQDRLGFPWGWRWLGPLLGNHPRPLLSPSLCLRGHGNLTGCLAHPSPAPRLTAGFLLG